MKIFLIFATLVGLLVTSYAQTTVRLTVGSDLYDVVYRDNVTFSDYQSTIDDDTYFWDSGSNSAGLAAAAYSYDNNLADLKFAYEIIDFGGGDIKYLARYNDGTARTALEATSTTGKYAISATLVPAPFPILGILPVAGFLKRMRKRQRAS